MSNVVSRYELTELQYELDEAELEIKRHHRDFAKIQRILDSKELNQSQKVQRIRNIVG